VLADLLEGERRNPGDSVCDEPFYPVESVGGRMGNILPRNEVRSIVLGMWGKGIVRGYDEWDMLKGVQVANTVDHRHLWWRCNGGRYE